MSGSTFGEIEALYGEEWNAALNIRTNQSCWFRRNPDAGIAMSATMRENRSLKREQSSGLVSLRLQGRL